jgi:DNA-binding Lrp family transcriptional regulator
MFNKLFSRDKVIIKSLSGDLPFVLEPYKYLAKKLKINPKDLEDRIKIWQKRGLIRRFGATLRHRKAGFSANCLSIWKIPKSKFARLKEIISALKEISHAYERKSYPHWPFNFYAMIHGKSEFECQKVAKKISNILELNSYQLMFSKKEFKKTSMEYF